MSESNSTDMHLFWLDVYKQPLPDGNIYMSSDELSPILDTGARIARITFSPAGKLLWFLVEANAQQLQDLSKLPIIQRVSFASNETWNWWLKDWRTETKLDPLLYMTADRINQDSLGTTVPALIRYGVGGENSSRQEAISNITAFVGSLGSEVLRIGVANYILARVPCTLLPRLLENSLIKTLEADEFVLTRGVSSEEASSFSCSTQLVLIVAPSSVFWCLLLRSRRIKLALLASLLVISFMSVNSQPQVQALNVSNPAINANQTGYTGNGVVVAVIDTGMDFNNPMLQGNIIDNVDITGHNDPMDYDGHGTHVAGIVASGSSLYPGIAPGASLINIKINATETIIEDGIQWCIDHKSAYPCNIRIIQLSWGTTEQSSDGTDSFSEKADDAVEAGISVVVAVNEYGMGNPEQAFNVVAVGAINDKDTTDINQFTLASYSSHGPTLDGRPKPDVLAPGDRTDDPLIGLWSARSSRADPNGYESIDGVYGRKSGTSMAAPHVSGTVALMLEANPSLTPAQVKAILRQTARLNNNLQGLDINDRGYGVIDAYAAVQLAQNVGSINKDQMYDSWAACTPSLDHGLGNNDYLSFTVDTPSTVGINMIDVAYHLRWFFVHIEDYTMVKRMHAVHVWIDGTYYDLGADVQEYLFSGPRVYEEGDGYVRMRALYKVGSVTVTYDWYMHVDTITFSISYSGGSSWKTLMYTDVNLWDDNNYAYLPSTGEADVIEAKIPGNEVVDIRSVWHTEYLQMNMSDQANTYMWILRETGNNYIYDDPDFLASRCTYVYNRDISTYFQSTSNLPHVNLARKTDSLPPR